MPARPRANWTEIKTAYLAGAGSCRELAEKFGVPLSAVSARCTREKWNAKPANVQAISEKVQIVRQSRVERWVDETIERAQGYRGHIDASMEQMAPAADPVALLSLAKTEKIADDMARRAFGLPDSPQVIAQNTRIEVVSPFDDALPPQRDVKIVDVKTDDSPLVIEMGEGKP